MQTASTVLRSMTAREFVNGQGIGTRVGFALLWPVDLRRAGVAPSRPHKLCEYEDECIS